MSLPFNDLAKKRTEIWFAASQGDAKKVVELIKAGVPVNYPQEKPCYPINSPIGPAADNGRARIIALLADAGADLEVRGNLGTPLESAIYHNQLSSVVALLLKGAQVNNSDPEEAPLFKAAYYGGDVGIIKALIDFDADVHQRNSINSTPLHFAAFKNAAQGIALLHAGADPNAIDKNGMTPLVLAVMGEQEDFVVHLLRKGALVQHPQQSSGVNLLGVYATLNVPEGEKRETAERIHALLTEAARQQAQKAVAAASVPKP